MDHATEILDEIALEGLDGITIEALWKRLSERENFICASHIRNDENTKVFLWDIVRRLRNIQFFKLEEPRKPLNIRGNYTVDHDLGILTESNDDAEDLYPYCLINENNILGSCSTYHTREEVTNVVRKLDLQTANNKYGNSLVIVASQEIRRAALISQSTNPNLEISPIQYCILERIGRSRYYGEPTQGKLGLGALGEDPRTIFYFRKHLLKHNLIKKQCYQQTLSNNYSGLLLHLTRFYKLILPKYVTLIETIMRLIKNEPNGRIDYNVLQRKLPSVMKKLTKWVYFRRFFHMELRVPYRTMYPDASIKDWKQKSCEKEKTLRVVKIRNPKLEIEDVQKMLLNNFDEDDDDDEKEVGLLDGSQRVIDYPLLIQCCNLLKNYGTDGLSQNAIGREMGLQKKESRTATRNLVRTGVVGMYMIDIGRQRFAKFYLKRFGEVGENQQRLLLNNSSSSENKKSMLNETSQISFDDVSTDFVKETQCNDSAPLSRIEFKLENECPSNKNVEFKNSTKRKINSESVSNRKRIKLVDNSNSFSETNIKDNRTANLNIDDKKISENINDPGLRKPQELTDEKTNNSEVVNVPNESSLVKNDTTKSESDNSIIYVTISDDYRWLLPKIGDKKLALIKSKSLNTLRLLKRSNLIMEAVNEMKVISDMRRLSLLINKSECDEGLGCRMDKKSLLRILFKLASDNHIKIYRVTLRNATGCLNLNFICNVSVKPDDSVIKSTIEFNKLKFHTVSSANLSIAPVVKVKKTLENYEKRGTFMHFPKFNRMSVLHKFLFYLVYDYIGTESLDQETVRSKIKEQYQSTDKLESLPTLFMPTVSEKMFVPPLPKYSNQSDSAGWCLLSDVLVRMPLSVFLQLVQIPYLVPELDDYINNPIKKFYLVNDLPQKIRNCMMATRKYIFSIFDVMTKLAYIGLIQFGAHQNKEKDQIFVYINRNTVLLDTTTSRPGYNLISNDIDYPVYFYRFNNTQNVEDYWHNCWKICMNTKLGIRSHVMGTDVILENIQDKQEMIDAVRAREFEDAVGFDTGYVPGDKLGAAGFDSALYSHLKRNWCCKNILNTGYENLKTTGHKKPHKGSLSTLNNSLLPAKSKSTTKKGTKDKTSVNNKQINKSQGRKVVVKIRRINPVKKSLHRKPFYDQIDKEALKQMSKLRVDWSAEEDRILLICKIASTFLCADTRRQINANLYLAFREVLHKLSAVSKNKTSRACQRRVGYMLRKQSMCYNISLCVEELRCDKYISEKYGNIFDVLTQEAKDQKKKITDMGVLWREYFKELVNELIDRYNNSSSFQNLSFSNSIDSLTEEIFQLPNDIQSFNEKFNLQRVVKDGFKSKEMFKPASNINDIYESIINMTMHSTLSCNSDKTSWSYHLFSIYQQYPERILRNVLNQLRSSQIVSFRKSYQVRGAGKSLYLPLTTSPYQLSISYVNLMLTKYQSNLYFDCFKMCHDFLDYQTNETNQNIGFELLSPTGGSTAAVVELYRNNMISFDIIIPDQVIVLDPNVKMQDETYSRLVQRYEYMLKINKKDLTCSVLFQKHDYKTDEVSEENKKPCDNQNDDCTFNDGSRLSNINNHVMQNVAKASSRIALYLMTDGLGSHKGLVPKEVDHVYDFFVINSCKVFAKVVKDIDGSECGIVSKEMIGQILQSIRDSAIFHNISLVDTKSVLQKKRKLKDVVCEEDGHRIEEYDDSILESIILANFPKDDVSMVKSLLNKIKDKCEFGMTTVELLKEFGNTSRIADLLDALVKLSFLLRTGIVECRYIYFSFARPWLLCSFRNRRNEKDARVPLKSIKRSRGCQNVDLLKDVCSDDEPGDDDSHIDLSSPNDVEKNYEIRCSENENGNNKGKPRNWNISKSNMEQLKRHKLSEPIKIIMRPWIRVDGTLNRRVLDTILNSVLSHIMMYPGIRLKAVQDRFCPAFQPQSTREICEILMKLDCIISYTIATVEKPSLLSKPCAVAVKPSTGLELSDNIRYEASRFAIINLGKFLDTKPYSQDLLNCLSGR